MEKEISSIQKLVNTVVEFSVNYSFQVIGALIVLVLGVLISRWVFRLLLDLFEKKKLDITLARFLANVVRFSILGFAVVIALGKFGITIAPFVAALGGAAFGASFAIQGPLSNYGAGLSIILTRPFVVGDTVLVAGVSGVVKEVRFACTVLVDGDGTQITIPNKDIVGKVICNSRENKVIDGSVGIGYEDDPEKAILIVEKILESFDAIARHPQARVGIQKFGDSSIEIGFRYWVPAARAAEIRSGVHLAIYRVFKKEGVTMPFPQREVRVLSTPAPDGIGLAPKAGAKR